MDTRSRTRNKRDDYFSFIVRGCVCFGNITKGRPYIYIYIYYIHRNRIHMSIYGHKQEIVIYCLQTYEIILNILSISYLSKHVIYSLNPQTYGWQGYYYTIYIYIMTSNITIYSKTTSCQK